MLLGVGVFLAASSAARAQVTYALTTLHTFSGSDGADPNGPLTLGNDGNFYGTTFAGGANNAGTIFRISPTGALTTLYNFTGGSDGSMPSGLVLGSNGNLYGTTQSSPGTVFEVAPTGVPTTIYSFTGGANGSQPNGPLVLAGDGNLYGTTLGNDPIDQVGRTIFRIDQTNTLTTVVNDYSNSFFGPYPIAIVPGSDGNLYVTLYSTGDGDLAFGSIYRVSPTGTSTFLAQLGNGSVESSPTGGLVEGSDGNFYGTTPLFDDFNNNFTGAVFTLTPAGVLTVLYHFTGPDGSNPNALLQSADGNFYGTTFAGGANNDGTVFTINPAGALTTLYSFTGGNDGGYPNGALVQGSDGSFYGTTGSPPYFNGGFPSGTIFKLVAVHPLPVVTVAALESEVNVNTGAVGHFQIVRQGGDLSQPLVIAYDLSGTALPGVDYQEQRGRKFIQPGMTAGRVPIVPESNLEGRPQKRVRLTLLPGAGYTLGTATSAVITLVNQ